MPRLIITHEFVSDARIVYTDALLSKIKECIDLLQEQPDLGSANIPPSLRKKYGKGIRRLVVPPFLIIYDYAPAENTVTILGLMHEKAAF